MTSDLSDHSEAVALPDLLRTLNREQLEALIERLARDSEAFAQRIEYLVRPHAAMERIAARIRAIRLDDESIGYDSLGDVATLVRGIAAT